MVLRMGELVTPQMTKEVGQALAHAVGRYFEIENDAYVTHRVEVQASIAANHESIHSNEGGLNGVGSGETQMHALANVPTDVLVDAGKPGAAGEKVDE